MERSPELFAHLSTGIRICYQTFGKLVDPAVILIPGNGGSMLDWPEDLVQMLNPPSGAHRRCIIRFDQRDTGFSTEFPVPGGYSLQDMAGDIEGLIDHLGLSNGFHLVGASKGGPLAYTVAARRPDQTRSLTLAYTSPGVSEKLPLEEGLELGVLPMTGGMGDQRPAYVRYGMALYDALTTQPDARERQEMEALASRITDRDAKGGTLYSKGPNHGAASLEGDGWPGVETLKNVKCPATVIQAAKDQFFGVQHGEALAAAIPDSEYALWEDIGHELPRRVWGRFAEVLWQTWDRGDNIWGS